MQFEAMKKTDFLKDKMLLLLFCHHILTHNSYESAGCLYEYLMNV